MEDMLMISGGEVVVVTPADWYEASLVGQYWNALQQALPTWGDQLEPLAGVVIDGYEMERDLEVIEELGLRGELEFHEIYVTS